MNNRKKELVFNKYQRELAKMVSDVDFSRYLGAGVKDKIKKYCELKNYSSINQLLPNDKDYCIILTENSKDNGHWMCVLKYGDKIEQFDSYGGSIDHELSFVPKFIRKQLGEDKDYLGMLLKNKQPSQKVIENKEKLQNLHDGVNTCGRWTLCRILTHQFGYDLPEFQRLVKQNCKEFDVPPDILVCDWIPIA
jgi:hypothetical protein